MSIRFVALETSLVAALRQGGADANGQRPERKVAEQDGLPCRHCLGLIDTGEAYLILAHRPFPEPQPYAEVGPIFLHAARCPRGGGTTEVPPFLNSPRYIVRGYSADHRIVYGTGQISETSALPATAGRMLDDPRVAYAHVRSASNNCFHCTIEAG